MRILILISVLALFSVKVWSQDPTTYLNNFDSKIYSLKTKGVKEFVVDIESLKLTKRLNDQMMFGEVKEVKFRTYWTANPERIAIEIIGLPEGFREIKEELKLSILSIVENLLPPGTVQRFGGYKFHSGASPKEYVAEDSTGIASVQAFILRFDNQDRMVEVVGKKAVGTLVTTPVYEKDAFADGKWVLKSSATNSSENGQLLTIKKNLKYGTSQGMGVLSQVTITTEQKLASPGAKSLISDETFEFKNYQINAGEALKYFLSDSSKSSN